MATRKTAAAQGRPPRPEEEALEDFQYYVHYVGFDRRLDEWVKPERMIIETLETAEQRERSKQEQEEQARTTRGKKRGASDHGHSGGGGDAAVLRLEKEHEELTKVKNIGKVQIGKWEVDTWYYSPYPDEYCNTDKLFVCEFCLKYMKKLNTLRRHKRECNCTKPPGRSGRLPIVGVYEEAGRSALSRKGVRVALQWRRPHTAHSIFFFHLLLHLHLQFL